MLTSSPYKLPSPRQPSSLVSTSVDSLNNLSMGGCFFPCYDFVMPMEDNPLARWIIERKSLEADLVRLQITLAQCAGHITLEQMDRLGVSIDKAVQITDRASLEALARLARHGST